jgi:hypothetical protein
MFKLCKKIFTDHPDVVDLYIKTEMVANKKKYLAYFLTFYIFIFSQKYRGWGKHMPGLSPQQGP